MAENKLADMSTEFAVKILNLTDDIKGHYSLANQLERSGTSIGANIREAKYAHSKTDFVAKLQISLKECYETEYWIEIAQKANIVSEEVAKNVLHDCGSIRRMLIASINTSKTQTDQKSPNFTTIKAEPNPALLYLFSLKLNIKQFCAKISFSGIGKNCDHSLTFSEQFCHS